MASSSSSAGKDTSHHKSSTPSPSSKLAHFHPSFSDLIGNGALDESLFVLPEAGWNYDDNEVEEPTSVEEQTLMAQIQVIWTGWWGRVVIVRDTAT